MRYAIDCDLHRIHCLGEDGGVLASNTRDLDEFIDALQGAFKDDSDPLLLYEIASPLDYTDNKAVAHNKRKWMLFNMHVVSVLWQIEWESIGLPRLRVSPSHKWTKGHPLGMRHALCKASARTKDLRECQAMLFFHAAHPEDWMALPEFIDRL